MSKVRVLCVGLAALALAACGQTNQPPPTSASASAPVASEPAAPVATTTAPESSASAQPIASAIVADAKLSGQACSLDTIDGSYSTNRLTLARGQPHVFRGWVLDPGKQPPGAFSVVLKGTQDFAVATSTGQTRKDVSEYFKNPAALTAGFKVSADLSTVPVGDYRIIFLMQKSTDASFCDSGKDIVID